MTGLVLGVICIQLASTIGLRRYTLAREPSRRTSPYPYLHLPAEGQALIFWPPLDTQFGAEFVLSRRSMFSWAA
jgi:hypothetical protein